MGARPFVIVLAWGIICLAGSRVVAGGMGEAKGSG